MRFSYLFLIVTVLMVSCKPDCPEPPKDLGFIPLEEEIRAMMVFKPGTWWIYQNTLTNELDTVEVLDFKMDTVVRTGEKYTVKLEDPVLLIRRTSKGGYVEMDNPNFYPGDA